MTVALMWEAKAAPGRGPELLAWARAQGAHGEALAVRREHFTAPGERILVITWWDADFDAELPEIPDPPEEFLARPVHRWRFERV